MKLRGTMLIEKEIKRRIVEELFPTKGGIKVWSILKGV